jgi:NAD(P)-dependent dehydrogenase (short-subunit alcohol dehydrogenase family)
MEAGVKDKVALITGGSAGIGANICGRLVDEGYQVLNLSRRKADSQSKRVVSMAVDLSDAKATQQVAHELAGQYPITTIIHNAGAIREKRLEEVTAQDLEVLTNLHVGAAITLVQANLAAMKTQHYGRIVLVSTRAVLGLAKRSVYSATKSAMLGLSRTWALELAPFGITSNVVAPGPVAETEMFHEVIPVGSPRIDTITAAVPVGRLGTPDDVARAVMFFVAPAGGFITGQTLFVCGGTSVGSITY